jgi:hypothetical protein
LFLEDPGEDGKEDGNGQSIGDVEESCGREGNQPNCLEIGKYYLLRNLLKMPHKVVNADSPESRQFTELEEQRLQADHNNAAKNGHWKGFEQWTNPKDDNQQEGTGEKGVQLQDVQIGNYASLAFNLLCPLGF